MIKKTMSRKLNSISQGATSALASDGNIALPEAGRVYAVVVGVEEYRPNGKATIKRVDYAVNDARGFAAVLETIFPADRLDVRMLTDNDATISTIDYELRSAIDVLEEDDLLVVYYAGHGFYGAGGNRITGWDTNPHHIDTTTVHLREKLIDRFEASRGRRMLAFVDACARGFAESVPGRDVVSDLNSEELREALSVERYSGIFLSCEPGQPSYPADAHKHGVWTYFLLTALGGEAEKALDRDRYLTDRSLRDYLTAEVPAFLRSKTEFGGLQRPRAIIDASRTFAIWQVPEAASLLSAAGDFSDIRFAPEREFFEHVQTGRIASLNGFSKKLKHFIPERVNDAATGFVRSLTEEEITDEIQALYEHAKDVFRLKRKATSLEIDVGQASLDTDVFRFSIEAAQDASDPSGYVVIRRLELREGAETKLEEIDMVFGSLFSRIVVQQRGGPLDFEDLVDQIENIAEAHGGTVRDEQARDRVSYIGPDGTTLVFDVGKNFVRLQRGGKLDCGQLLEHAREYRFGLTARSALLAGPTTTLALPAPSEGAPRLGSARQSRKR